MNNSVFARGWKRTQNFPSIEKSKKDDKKKKESAPKRSSQPVEKTRDPALAAPEAKKKKNRPEPNGFDKGYEAEKIIGATDGNGELMFLVKW